MIAKYSLFLLLLLAFVPMVQGAHKFSDGATTITLNPLADQVVDATGLTLPGTKGLHCRSDILRLYRSYLKFDLSGISDFNAIIGAELKLYCEATTIPPPTLDIDMHETGDLLNDGTPWEEMNLVWSNAPAVGDLIATTAVGEKNSWYSWDGSAMADYVKAECAGDKVISFVIKLAVEDTSITITPYHRDFADREKPNAPQLIITLASPMTISGHVFNDLDGNGIWDQGEPALEGWTVNLEGPVPKTTTSDSAGYYEFTDLTPGTYTISEVLQDGWIQTEPAPPGTYPVSLSSSSVTDKDFGNFKLVTITADKFDDTNGNGVKDDGEPEIPRWKLTITYLDGTKSTMDSPASWTILKGGEYTITEEPQDGWVLTTESSVDVLVQSGDTPEMVWFGNFKQVTITAGKFNDLNGNGEQDVDELEIFGWKLTLHYPDGMKTDTKDSPAEWVVDKSGTYTITEEPQDGWIITTKSSVDLYVESGSTPLTIWFGNFKRATVIVYKYEDADGDLATNGWLSDTSEQRIEVTDFNIVFTPSKGTYKISSTNPGGFYFNVLYQTSADPTTISYTLANNGNGDFVTKGSMPVHAYTWNDLDKDGKIDYWGELTDITNKITTAQEPDLAKGTIRVKGVPTGTNVLITIHITFALKGTSGYDLNGAKAFEGKRYTFTANDGFSTQATLTAHVKI